VIKIAREQFILNKMKVDILKVLVNRKTPLTAWKISKILNVKNPNTVYYALNELSAHNLIVVRVVTKKRWEREMKAKVFSLNFDFKDEIAELIKIYEMISGANELENADGRLAKGI